MAQTLRPFRRFLVLLVLLVAASNARADAGKDLFDKQCAGCHTIGGGDSGGPDLKGVADKHPAEWLTKIITDPGKLTAEKDPEQLELVKKFGMEMPKLGVSEDDAKKIVDYLKSAGDGAAAGGAAAEAPKPAAVVVTPELLAAGRDLFTGKTPFSKGGAPCVSCHALSYPGVHSGALAADLTELYGNMGEDGVRGILKSLSFPVMKKVYEEHPLTDEEGSALIALFKDASARKEPASNPYPLAGLGFFGLCIVAAILFKRRIK